MTATPAPLTITELVERPTISVEEAAAVLGIGRRLAYESIQYGQIPSIRVGRRLRVPTVPLLAMLEGKTR